MSIFHTMELVLPSKLHADTYTNEYFVLGDKFYFFRRRQEVFKTKQEIDTFGQFWGLAIAELRPGQVFIRKGQDWVPIVGLKAVWIPPHSLVHWRLGTGNLEWFSYLSTLPMPSNLPHEPALLSLGEFSWPNTVTEMTELVLGCKESFSLATSGKNLQARKLKEILDTEFQSQKSIKIYSHELGVSHEALTRHFKNEFGLPPSQYRNKVRLLQAMVDILMSGEKISDICQAVGFSDQSHFHHLFRREIRATPRKFRLSKNEPSNGRPKNIKSVFDI